MTREQIEAWRLLLDHHNAGELCDLAERALVLEDVLSAAKTYCVELGGENLVRLRAAIDRAEGR